MKRPPSAGRWPSRRCPAGASLVALVLSCLSGCQRQGGSAAVPPAQGGPGSVPPRAEPVASPPAQSRSTTPGTGAQPAAPAPTANTPTLVLLIVIDQLGSETLLEYASWFEAGGLFARAMAQGIYFERASFPYAFTLTAPGHATLATGVPPVVHGVATNTEWDRSLKRKTEAIVDTNCPVIGAPGSFAGPGRLMAQTVAEVLKQRSPASRVAALSLKSRASVFSVGRVGDLVLWYDQSAGRFTTSSCYLPKLAGREPALPAWLGAFAQQNPLLQLPPIWEALHPERYQRLLGPDKRPGEQDLDGFGIVFPHNIQKTRAPLSMLRYTPQLSDYLIALAAEAAREMELGQDEQRDLMVLSVSGTDFTGHLFGPRSWEYADHLLRVDRALGKLVDTLQQSARVAVVLTSDHGVAPLPESRAGAGGGRLYPGRLLEGLRGALRKEYGAARLGSNSGVDAWVELLITLSDEVRADPDVKLIAAFARSWLTSQDGVRVAYGIDAVPRFRYHPDSITRSVALSTPPSVDADIVVVPEPYHVASSEPVGTHHGSPYTYDTQVPLLIWGPGIEPFRQSTPVTQLRVAPTLAELLDIPSPDKSRESSLLPPPP